jgi:DNA-binding transcriptional LysR family regulator
MAISFNSELMMLPVQPICDVGHIDMNTDIHDFPSHAPQGANFDFVQLRHALAAADFGSFRRAAEALNIEQSTLSRSIRQLEHLVGADLFCRSSGGVDLTRAGRGFLHMARSMLEQADTLVAVTRANGRGDAGRISIGFCTSLTAGNLRATLLDFKARFAGVEIATVERSQTRLASALRTGVLDILILAGDAFFPDSKMLSLWSERILVVLPENHRLTGNGFVHWTDICDQNVLLSQYDPGRELEDFLNAKLRSANRRPHIEWHNVSRGVIKSLITMGFGISLVLESDLGAKFSGLVYRELEDGTGPSRVGFTAVWQPENDNPTLKNFLKLLAERYPLPST